MFETPFEFMHRVVKCLKFCAPPECIYRVLKIFKNFNDNSLSLPCHIKKCRGWLFCKEVWQTLACNMGIRKNPFTCIKQLYITKRLTPQTLFHKITNHPPIFLSPTTPNKHSTHISNQVSLLIQAHMVIF